MLIDLNERNVGIEAYGIFEVYLWLVIGKNRNNSENCHIVGIDQIMMSPI